MLKNTRRLLPSMTVSLKGNTRIQTRATVLAFWLYTVAVPRAEVAVGPSIDGSQRCRPQRRGAADATARTDKDIGQNLRIYTRVHKLCGKKKCLAFELFDE